MTEMVPLLEQVRTVLVVDWPSRDVPETLAGAGYSVVVHGGRGPEDYVAYEANDGEVAVRRVGRPPDRVDLVYSFRPLEELRDIVAAASGMAAKAVWIQSGLNRAGDKDPHGYWMTEESSDRARQIVESAGLMYVEQPYIADAVRLLLEDRSA